MNETPLVNYPQYPRSNFPNQVDDWENMRDINQTLLPIAEQYSQLYQSGKLDEAAELLTANPGLNKILFNAEKINNIMDGIKALQQFFKDSVEEYIVGLSNATIGIKDDASTEEELSTNAYSAKKTTNLFQSLTTTTTAMLNASNWTSTIPYTQSINISNITEQDHPLLGVLIDAEESPANVKAQNKAWSFVDRAITGNGIITLFCYNKKPTVDFKIIIKGV